MMSKDELKKELRDMGIKIYINKKTKASYAKKGDIKKAVAAIEKKNKS